LKVPASLHFNLTFGRPLSSGLKSLTNSNGDFHSFRRLLYKSLSRQIEYSDVVRECYAQVDQLRDFGIHVTGADGHHHVHLLPGVAKPMQEVLKTRRISKLRVMMDPSHGASYAQGLIYRKFASRELGFSPCFYLRARDLKSQAKFQRKLKRADGRPLLVHP